MVVLVNTITKPEVALDPLIAPGPGNSAAAPDGRVKVIVWELLLMTKVCVTLIAEL